LLAGRFSVKESHAVSPRRISWLRARIRHIAEVLDTELTSRMATIMLPSYSPPAGVE